MIPITVRLKSLRLLLLVIAANLATSQINAQNREDWEVERDPKTGVFTNTMELQIAPQLEPRPALKYRLIPDDFDRREGNAALFYLKAMGFIEQDSARDRLRKIQQDALEQARTEGREPIFPPNKYLNTRPDQFPVDEAKQDLQLVSVQPFYLKEASLRRSFHLDRDIREAGNVLSYLLPEIQAIRELARWQSVRTRLAIAEHRTTDAIELIGQQMALANHLGQDEFLVSNLVGMACCSIASTDLFYLLEHPDTPNLYWALSSLPNSIVEIKNSLSIERQLLFLEFKMLGEVTERPRPAEYWSELIDQSIPKFNLLFDGFQFSSDPVEAKLQVAGLVASCYPSARDYLLRHTKLTTQTVDQLCVTQTVLLGIRRCYEDCRDDVFKRLMLPISQIHRLPPATLTTKEFGMVAAVSELVLPAIDAAKHAQARSQQLLGLAQTIEALRMFAALNQGRLPLALDQLPVPAPLDPLTNSPYEYSVSGNRAILTSQINRNLMRYRVILRVREGRATP